jgi:uncharacterized protein (TIGR04141 family)
LFNQGINAIALLRTEEEAMKKLESLITARACDSIRERYVKQLKEAKFRVIFSIVTHKDAQKLSDNLPLFSRISLFRTLKSLQSMGVERGYSFIKDQTSTT